MPEKFYETAGYQRGRFELLDRENLPLVCIDLAHTPESLKVTLQTLDRLKQKTLAI